jgi:hypothetical protein
VNSVEEQEVPGLLICETTLSQIGGPSFDSPAIQAPVDPDATFAGYTRL